MKQAMTASDARNFSHMSAHNAAIVEESLDCDCNAYKDVFTFKRWLAQGRVVRRGQHGIKIVSAHYTDEDTKRLKFGQTTVFCRCQTDELTK